MTNSERKEVIEVIRRKDTENFHRQWRWVRFKKQMGYVGIPMIGRDGEPTPEFLEFKDVERALERMGLL